MRAEVGTDRTVFGVFFSVIRGVLFEVQLRQIPSVKMKHNFSVIKFICQVMVGRLIAKNRSAKLI